MLLTDGTGKLYKVNFHHSPEKTGRRGGRAFRGMTECYIYRVVAIEDGKPVTSNLLGSGFAFCSASDRFRKIVGHRLAFRRAVDQMIPQCAINRGQRAAIWSAYYAALGIER